MSIIKRKAGSEDIVKSILEFDDVPTEGSTNCIESGAVAKFTDAVPEGTTPENPLVNESALAELELAILSNITPTARTLRFSFSKKDYNPTVAGVGTGGTWTKLATTQANVWDWTKPSVAADNWQEVFKNAFSDNDNIIEIIAAGDLSGATVMASLFYGCSSLLRCVSFGTSYNVTNFANMYQGCTSLKKVPLHNTAKAQYVGYMFRYCSNVEGGALDLYTQMSTQTTPPSSTAGCFADCGKDTTTGSAELAQIPQSWGGTMPNP